MHGLVNRSIEEYLRAVVGAGAWEDMAVACGADPHGIQAIRHYPDALTVALLAAGAERAGCSQEELLEDIGAWLADIEPLRRLLRFSGTSYADFLVGLDQLSDRFEMVVPGFGLPTLMVHPDDTGVVVEFSDLRIAWNWLLAGFLRRMADDYGALALISAEEGRLRVLVPEHGFAEGRPFDLNARHDAGDSA